MKRSAAEKSAEPIHHRLVAAISLQRPDYAGERRERMGALIGLHLTRDHRPTERSLCAVVGRRDARIVQEAQQVPTVVVPAQFVLQPVVVRTYIGRSRR